MSSVDNKMVLEDVGDKIRGKKRKSTPSNWERNVSIVARYKEKEYTSYTGKHVPARTTGPSCRFTRLKFFEKTSEDETMDLFKRCYDLPTTNEQGLFIQSLIEVHDAIDADPKKRKVQDR
ncbi:hypothetical protein J6590_060792 [Homalodisca vitripennis]|nr:hypothetical protein J6590_060792 [Homalodisca vitripennis]